MFEKCRRVGAVAAQAVLRGAAGLGREGDDQSFGAVDLGKPSLDGHTARRPDRALQVLRKRVVATGIEHQDAQVPRPLQVGDDVVDPRQQAQVGLVGELGIDRREVVDPAILQGMAAVIEQGNVGVACGAGKADGRGVHSGSIEIEPDNRLEPRPLQRGRHVLRIVPWIGQPGSIPVGAIADHECDALVGKCVGVCQRPQRKADSKSPQPAHTIGSRSPRRRNLIKWATRIPATPRAPFVGGSHDHAPRRSASREHLSPPAMKLGGGT